MLRPNSDYLVAVSMQNTVQSTFVVVEIIGNQDSGATFKTTDSVSVEPFSTRIVRLEVPMRLLCKNMILFATLY